MRWPNQRFQRSCAKRVGCAASARAPSAFRELSGVLAAVSDYPGLPVVVHGFHPASAADLAELASIAAAHPEVPVVVGRLGGLEWITAVELAERTPNLWLDPATPIVAFAPSCAARGVPERCLFGTNAGPSCSDERVAILRTSHLRSSSASRC